MILDEVAGKCEVGLLGEGLDSDLGEADLQVVYKSVNLTHLVVFCLRIVGCWNPCYVVDSYGIVNLKSLNGGGGPFFAGIG